MSSKFYKPFETIPVRKMSMRAGTQLHAAKKQMWRGAYWAHVRYSEQHDLEYGTVLTTKEHARQSRRPLAHARQKPFETDSRARTP
jgi:hypothetical protein